MTMETSDTDKPQWDVALEALLKETSRAGDDTLSLDDLRAMATVHTIRLDDILDTLCQLVRHGRWIYEKPHGEPSPPDADMCKLLHANHRLNEEQIGRLGGRWRPAA